MNHSFSTSIIFNSRQSNKKSLKMTMWADNVKFVKDIVDSKYAKIETAAADVRAIHN